MHYIDSKGHTLELKKATGIIFNQSYEVQIMLLVSCDLAWGWIHTQIYIYTCISA